MLDASHEFPTDKNNLQPRVGFVWALGEDRRTVLRGNSGLMYDQPINAIYEQAIVNDGTPARASFSLQATQAGAPAFPNVLSSGNAAAEQSVDCRSGFPDCQDVAEQRPARTANRPALLGGCRRCLYPRLQPAGRIEHQPARPDRLAAGRTADLLDRHQRRHARRSALQRGLRVAGDRRVVCTRR